MILILLDSTALLCLSCFRQIAIFRNLVIFDYEAQPSNELLPSFYFIFQFPSW